MSDLQSNIAVTNNVISGDLAYVSEGALPDYWGAGNFLALKFTKNDESVTSVKIQLDPSASGMEPVELDEDMNAALQITSTSQKLKVIQSDGEHTQTQVYSLSGLTLESAPTEETPTI